MSEECVFCKIAKGDSPAKVVLENEKVIAFESIDPAADVHILVVPKNHIDAFVDISDSETIFEMTKIAQRIIAEQNIESGYKLVFNGGKYQYVPHLHWHVLGGKLKENFEL